MVSGKVKEANTVTRVDYVDVVAVPFPLFLFIPVVDVTYDDVHACHTGILWSLSVCHAEGFLSAPSSWFR